jgi:DNA-binding beta-propeller fold protein YncE
MERYGRWPLLIAAFAGLTACTAGAGAPSLPPSPAAGVSSQTVAKGKATLSVRITVPPRKARRGHRPRFVSPATDGILLTLDRGTPKQAVIGHVITLGAVGCSSSLPLTCTFTVAVTAGNHTLDVATYDLPPNGETPRGNLLSDNLGIPLVIKSGSANSFNFTLQGIPAGIAVIPDPNQDVTGTQSAGFDFYGAYKADGSTIFPRSFTVIATDADGNYILGAGAPAITLTSSNPSKLSNGNSTIDNPNRFVVTPGTLVSFAALQLTATATPSTAAGSNSGSNPLSVAFPVEFVAVNAPRIYVVDEDPLGSSCGLPQCGKVSVFDEAGNVVRVAGSFTGIKQPFGICYDQSVGALYVTDSFDNKMDVFTPDGTTIPIGAGFSGLSFPMGVACDPHSGRIYVGGMDGPVLVYTEAGAAITTSGDWSEKEGGVIGEGQGVAVDDTSNVVYVTDQGNGRVEAYDSNGDAELSWSPAGGAFDSALDPSTHDVYVTTDLSASVETFTNQGGAFAPPGAGFPNVTQPTGIARDPANGYFYVLDGTTDATSAFDKNGNPIPLPAGGFPGPIKPVALTIVP